MRNDIMTLIEADAKRFNTGAPVLTERFEHALGKIAAGRNDYGDRFSRNDLKRIAAAVLAEATAIRAEARMQWLEGHWHDEAFDSDGERVDIVTGGPEFEA